MNLLTWKTSKPHYIKLLFWIAGISLALIQAVRYRFNLSSDDIVSYLDVATFYLNGDWSNAINGNWSPLYSWILALALWLFRPSNYWEFPIVKLVNFSMFVFALASFDFFFNQFLFSLKQENELVSGRVGRSLQVPTWVWVCLGYTLFLFSSLYWLGISCDTPDMLTVGIVYLASGFILKIKQSPKGWMNFILLGITLGFGYFSKAVMFPLGFIFLAALLFTIPKFSRQAIKEITIRILVTLFVFLLTISPYVAALSAKRGSLTFSETGKLSYIWFVYPTFFVIPDHHWQGQPPEFGTPKNPIRQVFDTPKVLEFGEPIGGTYPLWTDPSYWYEGIIAKFNLKSIIRIFILNLVSYYEIFLGFLIFGYLILLMWSRNARLAVTQLINKAPLLIPAIAGLGVYAISTDFKANTMDFQPATRFIAAFIVLAFVAIFSSVPLPKRQSTKRLVTSLALATVIVIGIQSSFVAAKEASEILLENQPNLHWEVASGMQRLGMQPGNEVAIIGSELDNVFWARLARAKITVQLPKDEAFWASDTSVQTEVLEAIAQQNVDFIVYKGEIDEENTSWKNINDTGYYAYPLN